MKTSKMRTVSPKGPILNFTDWNKYIQAQLNSIKK
jgi:hypothetical protein